MEKNLKRDEEIIEMVKLKGKLFAVKVCKESYNISLKEAKEYVDELTKDVKQDGLKMNLFGQLSDAKKLKYRKLNKILFITTAIIFFILFITWVMPKDPEPISPEQALINKTIADSVYHAKYIAKQFTYDGSHIKVVDSIKSILNDPESFENVQTTYKDFKDNGLLVITKFRAKNGFGGVITQTYLSRVDSAGKVLTLYEQP